MVYGLAFTAWPIDPQIWCLSYHVPNSRLAKQVQIQHVQAPKSTIHWLNQVHSQLFMVKPCETPMFDAFAPHFLAKSQQPKSQRTLFAQPRRTFRCTGAPRHRDGRKPAAPVLLKETPWEHFIHVLSCSTRFLNEVINSFLMFLVCM